MKNCRNISLGHVLWLGLLLTVSLPGGGCRTAEENHVFSPPPADLVPANEQHLSPGEEINLRLQGTNYTVRIKEDGTISLPLVGDVKAAGKTSHELQVEVYELYVPRFYKPGTIPPPFDQRVYYVGGQVKQPGRQMYIGVTTVTKAIQSAGDFTDFAAKRRVELTRTDGQKFVINCDKAAKDPSLDLPVYPGDKINVPQRISAGWLP